MTTREERKFKVQQAIANERLAGLEVSAAARRIADEYIDGRITAHEVAQRIRARYGIE